MAVDVAGSACGRNERRSYRGSGEGADHELGDLRDGTTSARRRCAKDCDQGRVNPTEYVVDRQVEIRELEVAGSDDLREHRADRLGAGQLLEMFHDQEPGLALSGVDPSDLMVKQAGRRNPTRTSGSERQQPCPFPMVTPTSSSR